MIASVLPLALFLASPGPVAQNHYTPVVVDVRPAPGHVVVALAKQAQASKKQAEKQAAKQALKAQPKVWLGLALRERKDGPARLEVDEVFPDSPAASVDIRVGDKLVAVDGRVTANHTDVLDALKGHEVGDRVSVTVERSVAVTLGESEGGDGRPFLGVTPQASDDHAADWKQGVAIAAAVEGSAAQASGLRAGLRICAVDGVEVGNFEELRKAVQSKQPGAKVELRVQADLKPSLAARRAQEGDRIPRVSGESPQIVVPPPPQPSPPGVRGWSWNSGPEAGVQIDPPTGLPEDRLAPPGSLERRQGPFAPLQRRGTPGRAAQPPLDDSQEMRGLLEELRGLRRELAELRKELEVLRAKQLR